MTVRANEVKMWRQQVIDSLDKLFNINKSMLYGIDHAIAVEHEVLDILHSSQICLDRDSDSAHSIVVRTAALLHDVGYAKRETSWPVDGYEHLDCGKQLSRDILQKNSFFANRPEEIELVLSLVEHHDDTTYSYPTNANRGRPYVSSKFRFQEFKSQNLKCMLNIVKAADARIHTKSQCVQEAYDEWRASGVPEFSNCETLLTAWRWNDSVIGNLRLLGKRALVDSKPTGNLSLAIESYDRLEKLIKVKCEEMSVEYEPEICVPKNDKYLVNHKSSDLRIVSFSVLSEFEDKLRLFSLVGNKLIKPYDNAKIQIRTFNIDDVSPMALYVLDDHLEFQEKLFNAIMDNYSFGLWDLTGILTFDFDSLTKCRLAPPVHEIYQEENDAKGVRQVIGLVDGLHRYLVARRTGYDKIRAIAVSDVPYPLVPLPTDWDSIKICNSVPRSDDQKRKYRFNSLAEFPESLKSNSGPKDDRGARYFFFRDLSFLGSKGIRN